MRNLLAISVLAGLAMFVFAGGNVSAEDLVVFDRAKIAKAGQECKLSVIAKLDDKAVALIRGGGFDKLKKIDSGARLLDPSTNLEQLWVAGSPEDTPDLQGMIFRTDNFQLLKLSFEAATGLMSDGYYLSKCQRTNLPADPPFFIPAKIMSRTSITADIDSLMELVSADSVEAYIQRLQDFQTRYTCTDSFWAAGDWVAAKFESWGYDNVYFEEFDSPFSCATSRNVVAEKTGDVYPERYVIVGGHYDAVVYDGGDPNVYAPGADDNASGTALTLEIARVLADTPFRKTVRFIAFGAEEQGLYGSWHHATESLNRGDDIELMINADMIGNVEDSYLNFGVNCNETGEPYGQVLADLAEEHTTLIPEIHVGSFSGSDHYPFDQSGFRTVYSDEGDFSPNWHMQTDVIENVDVNYASDIVRSNLGLLMITMTTTVPVTDLEAFNAGDGETVYLQWSESPDNDVIAYEVYVGTSENGVVVYDTAYVAADTVYNLIEEVGYYFGVAALLSDGGRSLIEEFVQLTPRSIPGTPTALDILPQFGSLLVGWDVVQDMDFDYYQVYRKIGEQGDYQAHSQVSDGMTFTDDDLQSNVRYYYQVSQVDTAGLESDLSPEDYAKMISFDSGILLVDETRDYSGGQGNPTDAQQDSFYQFISDGYQVEFADINQDGVLRINDVGAYSTIAWMDDDATSQYIV
ncbi:MAG: M20/M25/M40 family metallo-hydrolase, partial [candidate division Zixibacteria bacterium]